MMSALPLPTLSTDDADQASSLTATDVVSTTNWVVEPSMIVCRPIAPIGDLGRPRTASAAGHSLGPDVPFGYVQRGDGLHWRLSTDDWCLTSPVLPTLAGEAAASAEAVLDVYVGLAMRFAAAGLPGHNTVRFSPGSFAMGLGWGAKSTRGTPTGRLYRQLDLALDYLRNASIESDMVRARLEQLYGVHFHRANFSVLQSWSKMAVVGGVGKTVRVEARFSEHFAALLRNDSGVVRYCAERYMRLPRGVPRALFRYVEGLRATTSGPMVVVPAPTVLSHIGIRRRGLPPSRMHEILDEPHRLLFANQILGDLPVWSKSPSGTTQLTYLLESTPDIGPLLRETALAYGVTPTLAEKWTAHRTDRLAEVLAAAVQGILTPTLRIGPMMHHYVDRNPCPIDPAALPHFEEGRGVTMPKPRSVEFEFLEEQYKATRDWLKERPEVGKALRRQFAGNGRLAWVVDGLVLLAARRMRRAESVKAWQHRVNRWEE